MTLVVFANPEVTRSGEGLASTPKSACESTVNIRRAALLTTLFPAVDDPVMMML